MPNHCGNRLTVTGDFKDRQAFVEAVREKPESDETKSDELSALDFDQILPQPEDVDRWVDPEARSRGPMAILFGTSGGWYGWRCKYWGTKWGAYEVELKHDEKETVFTFQTAWAPPNENLMNAMAAKFPNVKLDLRYAERGCEFYGYWTNIERMNVYGTEPLEKAKCWKFQNDDIVHIEGTEEVEEDWKLRPGLELYADLYEMSG